MAMSASMSATPSTSTSQVAGAGGFSPRERDLGDVAFVPTAGLLPAAAATVGTGAVASAPVLAAIAGGVLLVAAGAWALTPEQHRAALLKQTLATARGMLQAAGLAPEQINGHLRQIDRAFRHGKGAVDALVNQWRNGETSAPRAPAQSPASRVQPTGGARGNRPARSPQRPNGPQPPAASAPPLRSTAPPLSAADRRTLQGLHTQVEALQAQAGRVLTAEQLANGSLLKQLAQIEKSAAELLRHPGAQEHRSELTALQSQARQAVAGRYRFTAHKAVAGLLTTASAAGRQVRLQAAGAAPHAAQPYSAQALQQLLAQARQLLTADADAPLLAGLRQWLAQRQAPAPVLDTPGLGQSHRPAPALPVPPGQRSSVGSPPARTAGEYEEKALRERAEKVRLAAEEAHRLKNAPFNQLSDAQIAADVASRFGVSAAEVMSALASLGNGPQGAQGGTRSSAGQGVGGGANVTGSTGSGEPSQEQLFEEAAKSGKLRSSNGSGYEVTPALGLHGLVEIEDLGPLMNFFDESTSESGLPALTDVPVTRIIPIDDRVHLGTDEPFLIGKDGNELKQHGPVIVTDDTGKSYLISGLNELVAAQLQNKEHMRAHHFRIEGTLHVPGGDLILRNKDGSTTLKPSTNPELTTKLNNRLLESALKSVIDPRINLADLSSEQVTILRNLVEGLFKYLPVAMVNRAKRNGNNEGQRFLDSPEVRELYAEQVIGDMFSIVKYGRPNDLRTKLVWDLGLIMPTNTSWNPYAIRGNGSFEGFVDQLRNSKDPVVNQIRRAIVYVLRDFYVAQTGNAAANKMTELERSAGGDMTFVYWDDDPDSSIEGLDNLQRLGGFDWMLEQLKDVIDAFEETTGRGSQ